ncbi:MAG: c-type cytochrome [Prosthecobacter sp.]|uniref:c-type cytochrome n=1 Tax=Prosthecobacter sp. TaxID=1965333 RepID=UPI0025F7E1BD|nr:c-type cytochrome [Prosthecobacter sp.]MCF7785261.1 c-type cytochrome [Prosthecobacter sp.]
MSAPAHPDSTDLDRLHSAVKREKEDLAPETQPAPLWAMFLLMLVAIIAGGQLGPMTGGWSFNVSNPFATAGGGDPRPGGAGAGDALDPFALAMKKGSSGYAVCGGCHQGNGGGLPGQFPPLANSEFVLGGTERLIRIVQHGLTGPVTVNGQGFNTPGGMQPFGGAMSSQDLANVLTFVRNSWGNEASMITKEMVQKVRDEEKRASQWTAAELEPFADKNVPGDIPAGPGATAATAAPAPAAK